MLYPLSYGGGPPTRLGRRERAKTTTRGSRPGTTTTTRTGAAAPAAPSPGPRAPGPSDALAAYAAHPPGTAITPALDFPP